MGLDVRFKKRRARPWRIIRWHRAATLRGGDASGGLIRNVEVAGHHVALDEVSLRSFEAAVLRV
jgi:hypothetical protein